MDVAERRRFLAKLEGDLKALYGQMRTQDGASLPPMRALAPVSDPVTEIAKPVCDLMASEAGIEKEDDVKGYLDGLFRERFDDEPHIELNLDVEGRRGTMKVNPYDLDNLGCSDIEEYADKTQMRLRRDFREEINTGSDVSDTVDSFKLHYLSDLVIKALCQAGAAARSDGGYDDGKLRSVFAETLAGLMDSHCEAIKTIFEYSGFQNVSVEDELGLGKIGAEVILKYETFGDLFDRRFEAAARSRIGAVLNDEGITDLVKKYRP